MYELLNIPHHWFLFAIPGGTAVFNGLDAQLASALAAAFPQCGN